MKNEPITKVCEIIGSQAKLARALKITPSTVHEWAMGDKKVPLERCVDIEKLTGIRCEDIRPDKAEYFTYLRDGSRMLNPTASQTEPLVAVEQSASRVNASLIPLAPLGEVPSKEFN